MFIKGNELVERRDYLDRYVRELGFQEGKLLRVYLSKIDARNPNSRYVKIPIKDFCTIMGWTTFRPNLEYFKQRTKELLRIVIDGPDQEQNVVYAQTVLFQRCRVIVDKGQAYVELNASDDALPLMFDFKKDYVSYRIGNILRLKSPNQCLMYEFLKRHEYFGECEISVQELREKLGIAPDEYKRFGDFRTSVLSVCQKALNDSTDICFTYKRGKVGARGTWLTIIFCIKPNPKNENKILLSDVFSESDSETAPSGEAKKEDTVDYDEICSFYVEHREVIDRYRQYADVRVTDRGIVAFDAASQVYYPYDDLDERALTFNAVQHKALTLSKDKIKNLDSYLLKCLENEYKKT